jgi:hypothetical protein
MRMRWAGHVISMWNMRNAYNILVGKPEGKSPLGRSGHWYNYYINMVSGYGFYSSWFMIGFTCRLS